MTTTPIPIHCKVCGPIVIQQELSIDAFSEDGRDYALLMIAALLKEAHESKEHPLKS